MSGVFVCGLWILYIDTGHGSVVINIKFSHRLMWNKRVHINSERQQRYRTLKVPVNWHWTTTIMCISRWELENLSSFFLSILVLTKQFCFTNIILFVCSIFLNGKRLRDMHTISFDHKWKVYLFRFRTLNDIHKINNKIWKQFDKLCKTMTTMTGKFNVWTVRSPGSWQCRLLFVLYINVKRAQQSFNDTNFKYCKWVYVTLTRFDIHYYLFCLVSWWKRTKKNSQKENSCKLCLWIG